jgi:hypothetical protein
MKQNGGHAVPEFPVQSSQTGRQSDVPIILAGAEPKACSQFEVEFPRRFNNDALQADGQLAGYMELHGI